MNAKFARRFAWIAACLLAAQIIAAFFSPPELRAEEGLTNCADILALPAGRAGAGLPVAITGVVTASEPTWNGRFFIQDSTGGTFVELLGKPALSPGDFVQVSGITRAGGYAPCVTKPDCVKLGER